MYRAWGWWCWCCVSVVSLCRHCHSAVHVPCLGLVVLVLRQCCLSVQTLPQRCPCTVPGAGGVGVASVLSLCADTATALSMYRAWGWWCWCCVSVVSLCRHCHSAVHVPCLGLVVLVLRQCCLPVQTLPQRCPC